jgi:3-phenylpropionate/trans-cinnamate dioxygenase ferredoxin subunit
MTDFVEVAELDRVKPGRGLAVEVMGKSVALFNVDGKIYAIGDSCVHAGASLAAGKLEGNIVTCRAHGLKYDITTGHVRGSPEIGVPFYPVEIVGEKIRIAVM